MENLKVHRLFQIAKTGNLNVYYTLYITHTVTRNNYTRTSVNFIKNLSEDLDEARKKVTVEYNLSDDEIQHDIDIIEGTPAIKTTVKLYNMEFQQIKKNLWVADPSPEFWSRWKTEKQEIKDMGFWLYKSPDSFQGWSVFHKIPKD
ncbi:MAG: hypothetical protein ACOC22_03505 [bacterium]